MDERRYDLEIYPDSGKMFIVEKVNGEEMWRSKPFYKGLAQMRIINARKAELRKSAANQQSPD